MLSEESLRNKLYALYRLITIKHRECCEDIDTFIKYVYAMDVLWLNNTYRPFIWEDYIFIDNEMFAYFINRNEKDPILHEDDFDHLAKIDHDFVERILNEGMIYNLKYILPIEHINHIPTDGKAYFEEIRENTFFFDNNVYNNKLKMKRRELQLDKLLN